MMRGMKSRETVRRRPDWHEEIAEDRIRILFSLSGNEFGQHPDRSHRYVQLARKIGMRYNVKIPKDLKRRVCGNCHKYIVPGKNCIVRSNSRLQAMEIRCLECGKMTRFPYVKEKLKERLSEKLSGC